MRGRHALCLACTMSQSTGCGGRGGRAGQGRLHTCSLRSVCCDACFRYLGIAIYATVISVVLFLPLLYLLRQDVNATAGLRSFGVQVGPTPSCVCLAACPLSSHHTRHTAQLSTMVTIGMVLGSKAVLHFRHGGDASQARAAVAAQRATGETMHKATLMTPDNSHLPSLTLTHTTNRSSGLRLAPPRNRKAATRE